MDTLCLKITKISGYGNINSRNLLCVTRRLCVLFLIFLLWCYFLKQEDFPQLEEEAWI